MNKKIRIAIALSFFLLLSMLAVVSVHASGTSSTKCNFALPRVSCNLHNVSADFGPLGPDPCNGVPAATPQDLVFTGNEVLQGTTDGSHFTSTFEGTDSAVLLANGVVLAIHVSTWDGANLNLVNGHLEGGATLHIVATGSDGSTVAIIGTFHETILADGTITANFATMNLYCS
jgi:hypothetical protein